MQRIHIALATGDLERSIDFYQVLLGTTTARKRSDYAQFLCEAPALNLTLNLVSNPRPTEAPEHFGVEVMRAEMVAGVSARLEAAGLLDRVEDNVTCCYSSQDKVWAVDPDGRKWEVFYVHHRDAEDHSDPQAAEGCCAPTCCP